MPVSRSRATPSARSRPPSRRRARRQSAASRLERELSDATSRLDALVDRVAREAERRAREEAEQRVRAEIESIEQEIDAGGRARARRGQRAITRDRRDAPARGGGEAAPAGRGQARATRPSSESRRSRRRLQREIDHEARAAADEARRKAEDRRTAVAERVQREAEEQVRLATEQARREALARRPTPPRPPSPRPAGAPLDLRRGGRELDLAALGRELELLRVAAHARPSAATAVAWKESRKSSECSGSWWKSISRSASTRRAKVSVSVSREWPQPTCSGYSASVYWQSWSSIVASHASSWPEIHSGSRSSSGAPSAGSWSGM